MRIFGVILAGGAGLRMGGVDKALLMLAGRSLGARARDRLAGQVEALAISANGDPARLGFLGLPVLPDDGSLGPLSGLLAALDWAVAGGATALVSAPVDTPFLPHDLVTRLRPAGGTGAAIACSGGRDHPVVGIWPVGLGSALRTYLSGGGRKVRGFATGIGAARAEFPDPDAFQNLNTPEDLARAEATLA